MAKQLRTRPSEIYGIEDEVTAWSFDRAVLTFGNALESKLQLVTKNVKKQASADRKAQMELDKWLRSADDPNAQVAGRFRDPALL